MQSNTAKRSPLRASHFCAPSGEQLKAAALDLLAERRQVYVLRGRRALLTKALERGWATGDDVRSALTLPDGFNPVCLGAIPGPLVAAGIISRSWYTNTSRAVGHARPLSRWVLVDRAAAEAWLAANPDVPEQTVVDVRPLAQLSLFAATPAGVQA